MTEQEIQWFQALIADRTESANTLEKPSMRGVQRSVVDKYSDQAHFIYELLQNADDVKATSARFRLDKTGLYFLHDGPIPFTISDPATEDRDRENGSLGHINSITSIANSNKRDASIGKFGVGFKAVFQYTKTPHIYGPRIQFKIERFIVPNRLNADLNWRNPKHTIFWFPFDHKDISPEDSFSEILAKLEALDLPVLFLTHIKSIEFEGNGICGKYTKKIEKQNEHAGIIVQWLAISLQVNGDTTTQRLVTFSRTDENSLPYSIGYALDAEDTLVPISRPAYCFFPTKETTNLNIILHAPFLLNDSREGIKAGDHHNKKLIEQLAQLAADSLPILRDERLIDDGLFDIVPYDDQMFTNLEDRNKISFLPFYAAIKERLQNDGDGLLPAADGMCSAKSVSYWASDTELIGLFADKQLEQLTSTPGATWIFRSRGKKEIQNLNPKLADYISGRAWPVTESSLIASSLDPDSLLRRINSAFIAVQSHEWLHRFYAYLSGRISYQQIVKEKPIFLDDDGHAVPAFDNKKQPVLFIPDDTIDGYRTVSRTLLANDDTRQFIENFGLGKPSLRDEIYNRILPLYDTSSVFDTQPHFAKFFRYFNECKNEEVAEFIELIRNKPFLLYTTGKSSTPVNGMASQVYVPTEQLQTWFENQPDTKFLMLDKYRGMVADTQHARLDEFIRLLGTASSPRILVKMVNAAALIGQQITTKGSRHTYVDMYLDGCKQILDNITASTSLLLWEFLVNFRDLSILKGIHGYIYYGHKSERFQSLEEQRLRSLKWLVNTTGGMVSANDVTLQSLSAQYDTTSPGAIALIQFLGIRDKSQILIHLSLEEADKIRFYDEMSQRGYTEDRIRQLIEKEECNEARLPPSTGDRPPDSVIADIKKRMISSKDPDQTVTVISSEDPSTDDKSEDCDDFTPKTIDFAKKIERAKDRHANEITFIEREQELCNRASRLPRYSYGWFMALLELEYLASSESNLDSKKISISFSKIERDGESPRTIILKHPNRYIPQAIEELSGVRIDLDFIDGSKRKLRAESFTAKEFALHGRLESADDLNETDLEHLVEARIEIQNPSFLLEELLERFRELQHDENFDMKTSLTPHIEFVFGPPGTGKTTHLAKNVLIPRMQTSDAIRILVLTPTNKAADVLTNRVIETMEMDTSYKEWLVRFGACSDERIEKAGVWRDRGFNLLSLAQSVTITTIARFAYDGFTGATKLHEMNWDMIIIDEASMIKLADIMYPLYRQADARFIIAGDPFQIEPIVAVEQWENENIYTLVGLTKAGSFANPVTEPHEYGITNLDVQYRSIPSIGNVFSEFTYDGILRHYRNAESQRPLELNGYIAKPLNLIKFPVSKYESIYRAKRLDSGTPYQTYSALFTFEFVRWVAEQLPNNHVNKYSIGIIAPYRAQANVINKLYDSWGAKPDHVEIQVGTIHGFQGDECDLVIAVLNPPPTISNSSRMFLNRQNILNVAISRARDYLFIVMPDTNTEGIENLRKLAKIDRLIKHSEAFSETDASAIEELIWGNCQYLEQNTFSTGHQMVNVYRKPERYYEVRTDSSAIDVQVHETIG